METKNPKPEAIVLALMLLFGAVSLVVYADESTRDTARESLDVRDPVDVESIDQIPAEESEGESPAESTGESEETMVDEREEGVLGALDATEEDSYYMGEIVGEVKDVKYLSATKQIRAQIAYAAEHGYTYELHVTPDTKVSEPLLKLLKRYKFGEPIRDVMYTVK